MAQRVPLQDTAAAISCIERDGAVILTGFTTQADVEKVNSDAKPYLDAILQEVVLSPFLSYAPFTTLTDHMF